MTALVNAGRLIVGIPVMCMVLALATVPVDAQNAPQTTGQTNPPAGTGGTSVASTNPAEPALTTSEQTAVQQMLNAINTSSGKAMMDEVMRLAKEYSDQNFNLKGIARAVKTGAGNKLGAVNTALRAACLAAAEGTSTKGNLCAAAEVSTDDTKLTDIPNVANIQTAATGADGGTGAGGAGGNGAITGNATTDGGSRAGTNSFSTGTQTFTFTGVSRGSGSVGTTAATTTTSVSATQ